jgi:hypothetical protein
MRLLFLGILFFVPGLILACPDKKGDEMIRFPPFAPKVTREYLLAHGFKELQKYPDVFKQEHIRVKEVSRTLGFHLASLHPTVNEYRANNRMTANLSGGVLVSLLSEVPNSVNFQDGMINKPDTLCTATVFLNPPREKRFRAPGGTPRLKIKSVSLPENPRDPLKIEFELSSEGKGPAALSKDQFVVHLSAPDQSSTRFPVSLEEEKSKIIKVSPGKPIFLKASISMSDPLNSTKDRKHWSKLPPGKHDLCIGIRFFNKSLSFDYQWLGETWSKKYEIIIK